MPFEITFEDPRIGFASAHFIIDHKKCGRLHGHNYFIKVNIDGQLNNDHMVLDYGILKDALKNLTKPLDHKVLIPEKADGLVIEDKDESIEINTCNKRYLFPKEDIVLLPIQATTAEELARYFHNQLKTKWPDFSIKVTIEEAPGSCAIYHD
jgi:6-pyruvoyltetrahydropterin/6-carboxytetrahydropterin synthase